MFASRCIGGFRVPCVVFYIVVVLAIFAYGFIIRRLGWPDSLEKKITNDPAWSNCDGWAMTHLFFWAFLGFWYPGRYLQALGVSLGWEAFEDLLGRKRLTVGGSRLQLVGETDAVTKRPQERDKYWYGRYVTDTFYNLAGYIVGSALAARFCPEDACRCKRCRESSNWIYSRQ